MSGVAAGTCCMVMSTPSEMSSRSWRAAGYTVEKSTLNMLTREYISTTANVNSLVSELYLDRKRERERGIVMGDQWN